MPSSAFPSSFWNANLTELFERAAYYAMASFVVIYLGQLGFGDTWPSVINGSVLWFLVYFLPILSGAVADQVGFKRSLLVACVLLALGYFLMGYPVWFGGRQLQPAMSRMVTVDWGTTLTILSAVLLIGVGGSIVKPCIAGTVQKTAGKRSTLGFGIFYMIINIGSLVGRLVAYRVRHAPGTGLSVIFAVSAVASGVAFLVVLLLYREPDLEMGESQAKPRKSVGEILSGMVLALKSPRFLVFILVSSGFFFIYNQVYNLLPIYTKRTIELSPAMDLYTAANPLVIVLFQLLITKAFGKLPPIKSIVVGIILIGLSMLVNLVPLFMPGGVTRDVALGHLALPMGSLFITLTVGLIAFGELFNSSRLYEYLGSLSPKGQEGLYLGYANLPLAIGSLVGGWGGAWIFNRIMARGAVELPNGLLKLDTAAATLGWVILAGLGLLSALSMALYNRWLQRQVVQGA
nr:MFS transporter [uncultured Holophaga sp.]